jgi:hypothetical protein
VRGWVKRIIQTAVSLICPLSFIQFIGYLQLKSIGSCPASLESEKARDGRIRRLTIRVYALESMDELSPNPLGNRTGDRRGPFLLLLHPRQRVRRGQRRPPVAPGLSLRRYRVHSTFGKTGDFSVHRNHGCSFLRAVPGGTRGHCQRHGLWVLLGDGDHLGGCDVGSRSGLRLGAEVRAAICGQGLNQEERPKAG